MDTKYEDMLTDPCPNCGNYGHIICGFLGKNPRIAELEIKYKEIEARLKEALEDYAKLYEQNSHLEKAVKETLDYLYQEVSLRWVNEIVEKYGLDWKPEDAR